MNNFKFSKELKPFTIYRNRPVPKSFLNSVESAYSTNRKLFGKKITGCSIFVCDSAAEWRKASKYYHFPFARGVVLRDGTMAVKGNKFAGISPAAHRKIVMHEINHVFWALLYGRRREIWCPYWLVEGLACYVAKNDFLLSKESLNRKRFIRTVAVDALIYRYTSRSIASRELVRTHFSLWYHFVTYLCLSSEKVPVRIMNQALKSSGKDAFLKAYKNVTGCSLNRSFAEFLEYLNAP